MRVDDKSNGAPQPRSGDSRNRSRKARFGLLMLAMAAMLLVGCNVKRVVLQSCGDRRIDLAMILFDQAKEKLALHFQQRVDSALSESYQASQDSVLLARATRNCHDFDAVVRRQAIDLIKSNLLFQKLITSNMRDQDPGVVVDLYGSRYRDIFRNDIR